MPKNKILIENILEKFDSMEYFSENVGSQGTLASELQYLCQRSLGVLDPEVVCIPHNTTSVAIHGNSDYVFNRRALYQKLGFQKFISRSDFEGQETCFYSFRGICDEGIFRKVINLANTSKYNFIYALTLDSHFPYMKYQQHAIELYEELEKVVELLSNCCSHLYTIIIVGDHSPPLSNEFLKNTVPVFILKKRILIAG